MEIFVKSEEVGSPYAMKIRARMICTYKVMERLYGAVACLCMTRAYKIANKLINNGITTTAAGMSCSSLGNHMSKTIDPSHYNICYDATAHDSHQDHTLMNGVDRYLFR